MNENKLEISQDENTGLWVTADGGTVNLVAWREQHTQVTEGEGQWWQG